MNRELKELNKLLTSGAGYVEHEGGLLFPKENLLAQGVFTVFRNGVLDEVSPNLIVTQGRDYLLGVGLKGVSAITAWYIALFAGDVTVQATWTGANFAAQATEFTGYSEAARQAWTGGDVASGAVSNLLAKASFTINADAQTVRGAAMLSASAKGATTGTLLGASKFASAKVLDTAETLDIGYSVSLTTPA